MFRVTTVLAAVLVAAAACVFAPPATAQADSFGSGGTTSALAPATQLDQPVSAKLIATLVRASRAGLQLRDAPPDPGLQRIDGPRPGGGNKVTVLYVGADFCPFCAGQRWGLVLTLLRFGKFEGLRYMLSSARDVHPDTPTFAFAHAGYQSRCVAFQAVETSDRDQNPLMTPDKQQTEILATFDAPPYTRFAQAIPFVYVDGRYLLRQLLVTPQPLAGRNWQQIADTLADTNSLLFANVMPRVNMLTAAICGLDGGQPADVCTAPGVVAARAALRALPQAAH